jgi:hypothetical protein
MYPIEIWKTVENAPAYAVSNFGRVKRVCPGTSTQVGKILKPSRDKGGYLWVKLGLGSKEAVYNVMIHRLVALIFLGSGPPGTEINHKDGNKTNNHISNLEWCTRSENIKHAFRSGLKPNKPGEENCQSKLSNEQVRTIRTLMMSGATTRALCNKFGASRWMIERIRHNRTYLIPEAQP